MAASDDKEVLTRAKDRYKVAKAAWSKIYTKHIEDLNFLSDEPLSQWDEQEAAARTTVGRPTIQIDQLGQFVHQVTNDIRMNTPTINIIPSDEGTDIETAEMLQGRIKAIEYKSNADAAYDLAADFSVKSSIGFIRVDHEYACDSGGFEQELRIKRCINPKALLIDSDITEPDGSDAMYGFAFEEKTKKKFEKENPNKTAVSFGDETPRKDLKDDDKIVIAEYFEIVTEDSEIGLLPDGTTEPRDKQKQYKATRTIEKRTVMRYKLSGEDVLDSTSFPGIYVPIVPVFGEEQWIDGKRNVYSLIRKSKSSQRMYNLWKSLETELLLKQQQAPVQAAVGQMRGFEEDWKKPEKAMVLYYHQTDANKQPAPPPQRLQPPTIPTGIVNASRETVDDIKATMGMYNASIGARSNETSGIAIQRRQQEGDTATFHFGDNLVRSITQVGKILVSALPVVEDTGRVVQIIDKEEKSKTIGINGKRVQGQERDYYFNKGKHDVRVTTGAPALTQRQEAAAMFAETLKSNPELAPVIGDLVFKYSDAPGAQAIAARLKKTIDPKLLDESEREQDQPAPEVQALTQQLQQVQTEAQQAIGQLQQQLEDKSAETQLAQEANQLKAQEIKVDEVEAQAKLVAAQRPDTPIDNSVAMFDAETKRFTAEQNAKNQTLQNLIRMEELKLQVLQAQQPAAAAPSSGDPATMNQQVMVDEGEMARAAVLQGISDNLAALTAEISKPIKFVRDENGNIVEAA